MSGHGIWVPLPSAVYDGRQHDTRALFPYVYMPGWTNFFLLLKNDETAPAKTGERAAEMHVCAVYKLLYDGSEGGSITRIRGAESGREVLQRVGGGGGVNSLFAIRRSRSCTTAVRSVGTVRVLGVRLVRHCVGR